MRQDSEAPARSETPTGRAAPVLQRAHNPGGREES